MKVTVEKAPCDGCAKADMCKYAEDMTKAFNEIVDVIAKYDATARNLYHNMYCKHNAPPVQIPSFMK